MKNIQDQARQHFATAKFVINQPKKVFEKLKKDKQRSPHIMYLLFLWIVGSILTVIGHIFFNYLFPIILPSLSKTVGVAPSVSFDQFLLAQLLSIPVSVVIGMIFTLAGSVLLHLWIRLFKGKGDLTKTLQLNIYAMTPGMLFGWLPIVSFIASLYGLYLTVIGAHILHQIPVRRAIIMFVIIPLIAIIVATVVAISLGPNFLRQA
jgi:hypothetical protein